MFYPVPVVFSRIILKQTLIHLQRYLYPIVADGVTRQLHPRSVRSFEISVKFLRRLKEHTESVRVTFIRFYHGAGIAVKGSVGKGAYAGGLSQLLVVHKASEIIRVVTAPRPEHRLYLRLKFISVIAEQPEYFIIILSVYGGYAVGNGVLVYVAVPFQQFFVGKQVDKIVRHLHKCRIGDESRRFSA